MLKANALINQVRRRAPAALRASARSLGSSRAVLGSAGHGHGHDSHDSHGHDAHHGAAPDAGDYTSSNFDGPLWRNVFVCSLGALALWQANEYYEATKGADEVHPITAYISYHMTQEHKWKDISYKAIANIEREACDTLLLQELPSSPKVPRFVAPELLERGNPYNLPASAQRDFSGIQMRR